MSTLSFWNAFFGTELNKPVRNISDLFDTSRNHQHDFYGKKQAVWIDTSKPFQNYIEIPELRTVIDKKAQMISNGTPRLIREADGTEVEKHWMIDLIKNPNVNEDVQILLDEISSLRQQLLASQQQLLSLQVSSSSNI